MNERNYDEQIEFLTANPKVIFPHWSSPGLHRPAGRIFDNIKARGEHGICGSLCLTQFRSASDSRFELELTKLKLVGVAPEVTQLIRDIRADERIPLSPSGWTDDDGNHECFGPEALPVFKEYRERIDKLIDAGLLFD